MADDEGGTGGTLASNDELIAQYQTTRIRQFWASYKRIFQLTTSAAQTLDPDKFRVTNTFPYGSIVKLATDEKNADQFILEADKTVYVYKTAHRAQLLCQLFECISKRVPEKFKTIGPVRAQRLRKNGARVDCLLSVAPYGLIELDSADQILQEYRWVNVTRIGTDDGIKGFFFVASGRTKIFYVEDVERLVIASKMQLKMVGLEGVPMVRNFDMQGVINQRNGAYAVLPAAVSTFEVNKLTRRAIRPVPRQLHISEEYIVEKDASGFQFSSFQRIDSVYALVRSWTNPREFTIEYNDGSSRTYTCPVRDTLLAMLLDVCHAASNTRVIVTGEVSDGLRLMPRFAEEEYEATLRDAFFGASSIEAWFLNRLSKACRATPLAVNDVEQACRELNANVPCPGINPTSNQEVVKTCMSGVMRSLNSCLISSYNDERLDNSRTICALLQTLYRLIPCVHGFKGFVEVKEVDTRQLMFQLVKFEHDFVNYWTLEVLMMLCRCPLAPRNTQQEFINKHTLLTDKMLHCLIGLMSYRTEALTDAEIAAAAAAGGSGDATAGDNLATVSADAEGEGRSGEKVVVNPSTYSHIPQGSAAHAKEVSAELLSEGDHEVVTAANAADLINFTPNSLVVIGAASLLESLVSSRRDTSSPELLNTILDIMADRYEVLVSMLRSNSFLIMENAAILMYTLTKNRPHVSPMLKELALSECLVLKHFYNGVFSPSSTQRFISRFLVATWASGPAKTNPAKALLLRMIPSGLAEYLKYAPITEEHRKNLDQMEDEFYAAFVNGTAVGAKSKQQADSRAVVAQSSNSNMQMRMRKRISDSVREQPVERTTPLSSAPPPGQEGQGQEGLSPMRGALTTAGAIAVPVAPKQPENFRIMFLVMTQDHKLPDLIWNEQTRMELRTTLEAEIREFEREQRLLGTRKIAWNYQQFSVMYESLRDEMQVGPIYVRYFLDAGDTFLRQLENPSHIVLFEKLFRRVLVSVETNATVSVLCARCLCRLYRVCKDIIGTFDDMLIIVRMLEQATNLELQHCLLDLLVELSADNHNLQFLLDRKFVKSIIRYASLAHINPDQIGNVLARATTNLLMIKYTDGEESPPPSAARAMSTNGGEEDVDEEELVRKRKRSLWVPEDLPCPKTWYAAPKGQYPPPKQAQRGPFRVSELLQEFDRGAISDDWLVAPISTEEADDSRFDVIVDTGRWKPIGDYFQLRMQMLFPGKAVYSPAEVAVKALRLLRRLSAVHRSANSKGVPFYPNPISKRIMSEPEQLSLFAQLLLSNDGKVVDTAADLLRTLVEYNLSANSKLYLTGAFLFACRYTGNNFTALAKFFAATHLKQSFQDSAASVAREQHVSARSVLGSIVPAAMVCILANYGPERFAAVFTGDFDTPEVIWNAEVRRHMVEMIDQHLGDFPARLRQFTLAQYDFVPIPKIHYATLDKEIYVHEYYLKNLCDEVRFPEWPISQPLVLLRECIERWRNEMSKGGTSNSSAEDARKLLELPANFENKDLRKAYKNLARQYHPDRNPDGREMFERIQIAYELLSQVELQATQTDLHDVVLLMRTQCILYRRFPAKIADQKYPAYPLLVEMLKVPVAGVVVEGTAREVLVAGTQLMYYTTFVSPLNAEEFVKAGAVVRLLEIVSYALSIVNIAAARALAVDLLVYGLKALTAVSQIQSGQEACLKLCPKFADDIHHVLALDKVAPLAAENAMEVISRCSGNAQLQVAFVHAGVIWKLIPFLLAYDNTLKDDYSDESQRSAHNQTAANMHAIAATKALGRLGGFMFDELASPENKEVKECLYKLLTQPLARLLRNRRPWELLESLNENCEKTTKIWNVGMRTELLTFVQKVDQRRPPGSNPRDLDACQDFAYASLKDELCVGGVYVRIFNKTSETVDVDDPSKFCQELLAYIWERIGPQAESVHGAAKTSFRLNMDYTVEALRTLAEAHGYIAMDVATAPHGIDAVFALLQQPPASATFTSAAQVLGILFASPDFVTAVAAYQPPCVWRLLRCMCTVDVPDVSHVWAAAEALAAHPDGLACLLDSGAVVQVLGTLMAVKGYTNVYHSRLAGINLLSKFLWNPVKGGDASAMLRRFMPEPMVLALRDKAGSASLQLLDSVCENPELIWTAEMQGELREALALLIGTNGGLELPAEAFSNPPRVAPDYAVKFRQILQEIYVGGVYIRLYLKQPTFRLSNPVLFLEKLVEFWESCFSIQVPTAAANAKMASMQSAAGADSRALVLGNEDFVGLLTSCIVCCVKGEPSVVDHLITWGFVHNLPVLLQRALRTNRRGTPMVCIVRILFALVPRLEVVENLASSKIDLIEQLTQCLMDGDSVPRDAAVVVELLKKIYQTPYCRYMDQFVSAALRANLPMLVLNKILGASPADLSHVANVAALRIHSVDLLKAILAAADESAAAQLQALLDLHPAWKEFKHQRHDLFLTDKEKTDVYLIQDAMDTKFAGLLTDGTVQQGINEMLSGNQHYGSQGPLAGTKATVSPFDAPPPAPVRAPVPAPPVPVAGARPPPPRASAGAMPGSGGAPVTAARAATPATATPIAPVVLPDDRPRQSLPLQGPAMADIDEGPALRASMAPAGPVPVPSAGAAPPAPSTRKVYVTTSVAKGELGIGLDLGKSKTGQGQVLRLKEFPPEIINPASVCNPPILVGDVIAAVNGQQCATLAESVKVIRAAVGVVEITFEREVPL